MAALPLFAYEALKRGWRQHQLKDERFAFVYEAAPPDEWIAIDCEATGFDARRDAIVAIAAVRIEGRRVRTSDRLELPLRVAAGALAPAERIDALVRLLEAIGSRPLVGYYLAFDVALLNRELRPLLGIALPQPQIDVSAMYYELKNRELPPHERGGTIDLRFATMMKDLKLPQLDFASALDSAVMAALAFVKLRRLLGKNAG